MRERVAVAAVIVAIANGPTKTVPLIAINVLIITYELVLGG